MDFVPYDRDALDLAVLEGRALAEVAADSPARHALARHRRRAGRPARSARAPPAAGAALMAPPRALVVDWGGVLTEPLEPSLRAWAELDGIDLDTYRDVMASWLGDHQGDLATTNPIAALERGEIEVPHFEEQLAQRLSTRSGHPVPAAGLLQRMFDQFARGAGDGRVGAAGPPRRSAHRAALELVGQHLSA